MNHDTIVVLDYGSQTAQLIARRLREVGIYSELVPWNAPEAYVMGMTPLGFVLSGGPNSVYAENAPTLPRYIIDSGLPVLGICYGMQVLTDTMGGKVASSEKCEFGPADLALTPGDPLFDGLEAVQPVWMSHGDRIEQAPPGFEPVATTSGSPIAAMRHRERMYYGVQFHPEVSHTPGGTQMLSNFATAVCGAVPDWTPAAFIEESVTAIQAQVGDGRVVLGLSGGVDSSVVAALLGRAIGDQLVCVFVDHGMLRKDEAQQVIETFGKHLKLNLVPVNASEDFLDALKGVTDPEQKRTIIGELFIRTFESTANSLGEFDYLAQGTIYPDVIESAAPDRPAAHRIKSHHNVGGLPEDIDFDLVEPLRYLFKDEVRRVGEALGLPEELVWRQPFPGPGLAIRCLGAITWERLERLRAADAIFREELQSAGLLRGTTAQAFAVLLPVQSVGVMGDGRTYADVLALRAVATDDFMTADWSRLPYDLLAKVSARVVNEVAGINRVVYDVTSKPPATIEWE